MKFLTLAQSSFEINASPAAALPQAVCTLAPCDKLNGNECIQVETDN